MKNGENKKIIKEEIKDCHECSHYNVCKQCSEEHRPLLMTESEIDNIGKRIAKNCGYFYYKKMVAEMGMILNNNYLIFLALKKEIKYFYFSIYFFK